MADRKIVKVEIGPYPRPMPMGMFDQMPKVNVKFEGEDDSVEWHTLFSFYPDELSFREEEFIGLTEQQAMNLRLSKDVNYLHWASG